MNLHTFLDGGYRGCEVNSPVIFPWMEKPSDLPACRIDPGKIRTLFQVATPAGKGEIIELGQATVLLGDDMFDVKWQVERNLRNAAILATVDRAPPNFFAQFTQAQRLRLCRALDCQ